LVASRQLAVSLAIAGALSVSCLEDFTYLDDVTGTGGTGGTTTTTTTGGGGTGGTTTTTGGGGSGAGGAGGTAGAGGGCGGGPTCLVDRSLVARYYIDEAAAGTAPAELIDSAPNPLNLPITYAQGLAYVETGDNRGLRWTTEESDGRALASAAGTKIANALGGSTTATVELVVDVVSVTGGTPHPRLVFLGGAGASFARLGVNVHTVDELNIRFDTLPAGTFPSGAGRQVVHLVVNTALGAPPARRKLYRDGIQAPSGGDMIAQGATLTVGPQAVLCLGNRPSGGRSPLATLYYGALYAEALTDEEVAHNAQVLAGDDDHPL